MGADVVSQGKNQFKGQGLEDRRNDIRYIDESFGIAKVINNLHKMSQDIVSKEISAENINAACNCIGQLNNLINTTINAARFLNEK